MEITTELVERMIAGEDLTVGKYTFQIDKIDYGEDGWWWGVRVVGVVEGGVTKRLGAKGIEKLRKVLQDDVDRFTK